MATILDVVKHCQRTIEKYPNEAHRVIKSIDKLFHLDVTVQHLQETGVGRTVNALRKDPGEIGQAARALVYKWKLMVAAEESDQDGDQSTDTTTHNGHENGRDSDDSARKQPIIKQERLETTSLSVKTENQSMNGHHSGNKRKYRSSEEEEPDTKKRKSPSNNDSYHQKANVQVKREPSDSGSEDSDQSHSSDSESSEYSEEDQERNTIHKVKQEPPDHHKSKHSSPHKNHVDHKRESFSSKAPNDSDKHSKSRHQSESIEKKSSDKLSSEEKSHSSHNHKSLKDKDSSSSEKKSKSERSSSNKDKKHKEESSSSKHKSSSDKHKSSKSDSSNEKHISNSEKHSSKSDQRKSSSHSHKSDKDKQKSSSEKDVSSEKHKSKDSNNRSSKEKHSSSSKKRSKDRSSSSKEKSDHSHKSEKKHSSSDSKSKQSDSKHKPEKKDESSEETKSKRRSNSSHTDKSSSSKSKEEVPKKKAQDSGADSDDGINCGSGASFAEALGMISPVKPKKKNKSSLRDAASPNTSANEDLSPASLLAPTAKLAPLPALEISALPEISPNYKPRPPPKMLPHFTDEETMIQNISSKNQRTKVYSGNKVIGKITTLYEMCVQVLQEHIDALEYTGGVPYDILKPVVDRATPQQLFMLEHYNPYLMEDTDHLWQNFCVKHFRNKQRQELETWREMYMRCQEEQEHRLKSLTTNIRIAQEAKKAPIKQTKMAYVDTVVKPPRNIARKQALHGTAHSASASPAARVASLAAAPNVLRGSARPSPSAPSPFSQKPKKAPLMQKALQFMRGRKR